MGTLFSGIGLVSGFDIAGTVDRLIQLEGRPRDQLLTRIQGLDAQKAAYLDISSRVTQMLSRLTSLKARASFTATSVTSSNSDVLAVSAGSNVPAGNYSFQVRQLAATHQLISRGFASRDAAIGVGSLTIEPPAARVNPDLRLDELNGYAGVQRGRFRLTDGTGASATVDITDALSVGEVVQRINDAGLAVSARLSGDALVLTEANGGTITVAEDGGRTAADLGLLGPGAQQAAGALRGGALMTLSERTPLGVLNDGNGVGRSNGGGDFTITDASGQSVTVNLSGLLTQGTKLAQLNHGQGVDLGAIRVRTFSENGSPIERTIDLSAAETIGDVQTALQDAVDGLTVTVTGNKLVLAYDNGDDELDNRIEIEDLDNRTAADLGLVGETTTGRITGGVVLTMDTLGDVLAAINHAPDNTGFTAAIEGTRLTIRSNLGAGVQLDAGSSSALADLGLEGVEAFGGVATGARILGGLNTTLLRTLNGGNGFQAGVVRVSAGGTDVDVDLSAAETLQDALDAFNAAADAAGAGFTAAYDRTGTRIELHADDGATLLSVQDVSGDFAAVSGLAGQSAAATVRSENLQRQYISEATSLSTIQNGAGVGLGRIKITNAAGVFQRIDLSGAKTVGDVLRIINGRTELAGMQVTARINDQGDGIVLEDASTGEGRMKVEDETGSAARDLRLAGEASGGVIDGSFEVRLQVGSSDTLSKLQGRINAESRIATATILNDGSGVSPYRLQIASRTSGRAGELIIDTSGLELDLTTLARAQDAKVIMGSDSERGILLTSGNNSINGAIQGLNLELLAESDAPVQVTASQDRGKVVEDFVELIGALNDALGQIDSYTDFDPETEVAGVLLGDGSLQTIEARLRRLFTASVPDAAGGFSRLAEFGVSVKNGRLELDETTFRERLDENPEGVIAFFTDADNGFARYAEEQLKALTESDGLLTNRQNSLQRQRDLLNERVEDLNGRLERKRERLTRQFLAMEEALAELQSQQASLQQLQSLAAAAQ